MKKRKKKLKIIKLLYIFSILLIIILIYFYNDNLLMLKSLSSSLFNLKDNTYKSKENIKIKELEKEIKDLKELNNINIDKESEINASIVMRNNSYWNDSFIINVGKKDGVKKGNAVTYNNNLIGIVDIVNNNTSIIRLITSNSKNYISACFNIEGIDYYGIIKKYNVIKNELYLENVIGDFNINNEEVFTSGLDGNTPRGIYIGKIIGIKKDKYNLSSKIIVKPDINYNSIKYVKVIIK